MQKIINLRLLPSESSDESVIRQYISSALSSAPSSVSGFHVIKRSIDARGKQPWVQLSLKVFINEPAGERELMSFEFKDTSKSPQKVLIVGAGPAGLFAALKLLEAGVQPIIIERGKDVRARRRDLARLNKEGEVNPESNYCFGEGGAGTYSDGKLYTRSTKRGDLQRILHLFVSFGADERILYEAHPHIGTNQLPAIITSMRKAISDHGGKIFFEKKLTDIIIESGKIAAIQTADGEIFKASAYILATGHSARDIFELLHHKKIRIESKPFALGVRIEHPQALIDQVQYHTIKRGLYLPPAAYSWVEQLNGKGVFSFCMCPGGIIAPAATSAGELVVNGWSPSKRNNPYANSGIVVSVEEEDIPAFKKYGPLSAMHFQRSVEEKAFAAGGGKFVAPAQRMMDLINGKISKDLPKCSYLPGIHPASIKDVLPSFIFSRLKEGFRSYGKKMRSYLTNEAVVVATESRTSSPVRIPRDPKSLQHPSLSDLYPCGEGAGYAGGIVSAAMDGERVVESILTYI